jgi:hypothetical protein
MSIDFEGAVIIPLFSNANFSQVVTLDGVQYTLYFHWNGRGGFWSMDIADGSGAMLLAGIRMVVNYPLTLQYNIAGLPTGIFFLIDESNETWTQEAGRDDFTAGRKLELRYASKI